jgi:hypothetical protein
MEVLAAVAFAIAITYLWMRWDEHREFGEKEVEQ